MPGHCGIHAALWIATTAATALPSFVVMLWRIRRPRSRTSIAAGATSND